MFREGNVLQIGRYYLECMLSVLSLLHILPPMASSHLSIYTLHREFCIDILYITLYIDKKQDKTEIKSNITMQCNNIQKREREREREKKER